MIRQVIAELQSLGLRVENGSGNRTAGAGPSEGRALLIEGMPVFVPISSPFVCQSPYSLREKNGTYLLLKNDNELFPIDFVGRPKFYDYETFDGVEFSKIALLHGKDCLATTVFQKCIYWNSDKRCKFCGIEISFKNGKTVEKKMPAQLAAVAKAAKDLDNVSHVVLTTGTAKPEIEYIKHLCDCAEWIKSIADLPIHLQIEPPSDVAVIDELKEAGVDSIGIHIESFDFDVLTRVAPAKAQIGLKKYMQTWEKAIAVFGTNQVSSFLIVGLGETRQSIIVGSKYLADLGVYPFIVPLRPIPGSLLEDATPPPPNMIIELYEQVGQILRDNGISSANCKAGCVRCGACSALREYEK